MEPGYVLAVCVGCFSMGLTGPVVPDKIPSRALLPQHQMTRCFVTADSSSFDEHPYPAVIPRKVQFANR